MAETPSVQETVEESPKMEGILAMIVPIVKPLYRPALVINGLLLCLMVVTASGALWFWNARGDFDLRIKSAAAAELAPHLEAEKAFEQQQTLRAEDHEQQLREMRSSLARLTGTVESLDKSAQTLHQDIQSLQSELRRRP